MTDDEQGERDHIAFVLDVVLAVTRVALNAEDCGTGEPPRRNWAKRPLERAEPVNSHWLKKAS
jgi:hypothetical protein